MKRDFTSGNLSDINLLFDGMSTDENYQIVGKAKHIASKYSHALSVVGGNSILHFIEHKNEERAQMKRHFRQSINNIFGEETDLDSSHGLDMMGFGLTYNALVDLQNAMKSLSKVNDVGSVALNSGNRLLDYFNPITIMSITSVTVAALTAKLEMLEIGADYNAHDFCLIPNSVKAERIKEVEQAHPEYQALFAAALSDPDLTDQERIDIKFMAYSAPEPYRSLYLEHLPDYKLNVDGVTGNYYSPGKKQIHFYASDQTFENNPRGAYITAFHESGHLIDDYESGDVLWIINSKTENYTYNGKTLNECVTEDTRNYVRNILDTDPAFSALSDPQKQQLMKNLNLTDDAAFAYQGTAASPTLQPYQTQLQSIMQNDLHGQENTAPSDVYGGVTNNAVVGSYGHWTNNYWYKGGKTTNAQESELWAEFFASQMARDEEALANIKAHFPQAYEAMESMANDMLNP